jgi:predicted ATPase/transcriptional regulator with XRE-family HTH domain
MHLDRQPMRHAWYAGAAQHVEVWWVIGGEAVRWTVTDASARAKQHIFEAEATGGFGDMLRRYRLGAGLTQADLAERAGISERGVSDLERGARRSPHANTVWRLAQALNLDDATRMALASTVGYRPLPIARALAPHSELGEPGHARGQPRPAIGSEDSTHVFEGRALPRPTPHMTALPVQLSSFVGRDGEVARVREQLETSRLLSLVGPGGIGKTRLALATAHAVVDDYANGVAFVDLSPVSDASLTIRTLAAAVGVEEQPGRSLRDALVDALQPRQCLLLIDNCEHVVQACADSVDALLQACTALRVLATSREPLGVGGEIVWRVPSLPVPAVNYRSSTTRLEDIESVKLLVERARAVQPTFRLTHQNAQAVAEICTRLDGIPLAIELAAARLRLLSPRELVDRLAEPLRVLTRANRTAPARQQTLRATLEWSYGLLAGPERHVLARLSVFAGAWDIAAAEAICAGDDVTEDEVLDLLGQLVDKSLVVRDDHGETARYRLLEPVRQYAAERLEETGQTTELRQRHRAWCMELARRAEPEWFGPHQGDWVRRLEQDYDNLRAALSWSIVDTRDPDAGLALGAGLWRFWDMRSYFSEGGEYLRQLLNSAGATASPAARARALTVAGYLAILRGAHDEAKAWLDEAERFWRVVSDPAGLAAVLFYKGLLEAWSQTQIEPAEALFDASLRLARQTGPEWVVYFALMRLGDLACDRGDWAHAERLLTESRDLTEAAGDRWSRSRCLHSLGRVHLARGEPAQAGELFRDSLALASGVHDQRGIIWAVEGLAAVAAAEHDFALAARLIGKAAAIREVTGQIVSAVFDRDRQRTIETTAAALGPDGFASNSAAGRNLELEHIPVAHASHGIEGAARLGAR